MTCYQEKSSEGTSVGIELCDIMGCAKTQEWPGAQETFGTFRVV